VTHPLLNPILDRRGFLGGSFTALAGLGLLDLLRRDGIAAEAASADASNWRPGQGTTHFPAKAKRVLQVFCPGAASHMDLWDYKPELFKHSGEPLPGEENLVSFQGKNGNLMAPPWEFVPCGESGKRISSLLPHMARHVDDIAFIHSPRAGRFSRRRRLARLRARQRQRQSPHLRRPPRPARRASQRQSQLEPRISPRPPPGDGDGRASRYPQSPAPGVDLRR
jgi:hypothetical protein